MGFRGIVALRESGFGFNFELRQSDFDSNLALRKSVDYNLAQMFNSSYSVILLPLLIE